MGKCCKTINFFNVFEPEHKPVLARTGSADKKKSEEKEGDKRRREETRGDERRHEETREESRIKKSMEEEMRREGEGRVEVESR